MGYGGSLSGAEWLPGELDALWALEPPVEEPMADPWDESAPDPGDLDGLDDVDLDRLLGSVPEISCGSVVGRFAAAVACLESAVDAVAAIAADPGLQAADGDRLIDWTRELERTRNKLQVPDQVLINLMEANRCRTAGPIGLFSTEHQFLAALLGIPVGEARSRVRAAQLLAPTSTILGDVVPARYPALAAAEATGEISRDRVDLLTRAFTEWEKLLPVDGNGVTEDSLAEAEELLADQSKVFDGRQLGQVIDRVAGWLLPDGMLDDRPAQDAVRQAEVRPIGRGMRKGMYRMEGHLTAEAGAKLLAVLDPLSKPRPVLDESGRIVMQDRRDRGMRLHDALEEVADRALRSADLPAHGGTPATLILIAEEDDFVSGEGAGTTETGDVLPMDAVAGMSDEAEIVRVVFHSQTHEVLDLGRTRRLASYAQTLALVARDGGCTFPGCSKSPKWCQRHHIVDWAAGGPTDLDNLALLCGFHHQRFARHGWSSEQLGGRVWWRPPKIIDPAQKPILNTRFRDYPLIT